MILEAVVILGGSGALSAVWVALLKWARRDRAGEDAKLALLKDERRHADHELTDIRSDAFKPNELVATLCITCDVQLSPKLWQGKLDAELAALSAPAPHAELQPKYSADSPYIEVRPMIPPLDIKLDSPKSSWSADDYRRRNWTTEILESNYDHSQQLYILPLFQRDRPGRVSRLSFQNRSEATAWWQSCIPYDDFAAGRRTVRRSAGGIKSFTASRAVTWEEEKLTEQIARLTGIPPAVVGKMSAAQAADALNQAALDGLGGEVEIIRSWGGDKPIVVRRASAIRTEGRRRA